MCRIAMYEQNITMKPSTIQDPLLAAGAPSVSHSQRLTKSHPQFLFPKFKYMYTLRIVAMNTGVQKRTWKTPLKTKSRQWQGGGSEKEISYLERGAFICPGLFWCLLLSHAHFGDKSWRDVNGELLDEEGDTPSILPGESVEELTLLRLPSSNSGE